MKKAYLLLLAGMLSTVTYADNNQTVKIEGSIIDKVVTEITFDGDEVVLHYSDNSSDTKDMSLVAFRLLMGRQRDFIMLKMLKRHGMEKYTILMGNWLVHL